MPILPRLRNTCRSLFRKTELDSDLDEELRSYLDLLTDQKIREGVDPDEARSTARAELGKIGRVKENVRERRLGVSIETFMQDIRYAFRGLRKNAGFAAVAILILAIGIGASSALFTTIHSVLLSSIPYDAPESLVVGRKTIRGVQSGPLSRVNYLDYREMNRTFDQLAAIGWGTMEVTMTGGSRPELLQATAVTWNLFDALRVEPVLGRSFALEDETSGDGSSIVIDFGVWQNRFGGDPGVVGRTIHLDGTPYVVIGVVPRGFRFLFDVDVWLLISDDFPIDTRRDAHSLLAVGRMNDGVGIEQATADLGTIASGLAEAYPEANAAKSIVLTDLHQYLVRGVSLNLQLLMATTVLVLLIACANVAGLLLARGERRMPEIAMRGALGASRLRLVRQLLTESVVLTAVAGMLGIAVAWVLQVGLLHLLPIGGLGFDSPVVNGAALSFTLLVSILCGVVVGVVPALRGSASHPARQLGSTKINSQTRRNTRLQNSYVVVQVAISIALLVGSTLLIRSLARLSAVDLGFSAQGLLSGEVNVQPDKYPTDTERALFFASLLDEVESLPGVLSAALTSKMPLRALGTDWPTWPADQPQPANQDAFMPMARWVSPGYFETMGMSLLGGRDIDASDDPSSAPVIVLSESAVRGIFGDADAIGREVRVAFGPIQDPIQVVGVVADARLNGLRRTPDAAMYMSASQFGANRMWLAARTSGDPDRLTVPISELVQRKDPDVVFSEPVSMATVVGRWQSGFRVVVTALTLFSAVALVLTVVGLYGVLAYNVSQRTNEIGIRLAVGASSGSLIGMVLRQGWKMVGPGLVLGLAAVYPVTLLIRPLLFAIEPLDPPALAGAIGAIAVVTTLAAFLPALRATRVNVVDVLGKP
jgi:putative ABC transport system permease protein